MRITVSLPRWLVFVLCGHYVQSCGTVYSVKKIGGFVVVVFVPVFYWSCIVFREQKLHVLPFFKRHFIDLFDDLFRRWKVSKIC